MSLPAALLTRLAAIVGPQNLVTDAADLEPFLAEERGKYHGRATAAIRPGSTEEVAQAVAACAEAGIAIVPQGGNTGLCGGAVSAEGEIVVSLARMNRIRAVDPVNFTMIVEAGVILQSVQAAADEVGCLFPLSLGAEGSCLIGGNIATNAGGVNVVRYGNTRDLVLGLEVVLADGRVWHGLRTLRKDNTGYDLKDLFVGSEGTLGIITAASLKLFPKPRAIETALVALSEVESVLGLLQRARSLSGDAVAALELIPRIGMEMATKHLPGARDPFTEAHPWYALIELTSSRDGSHLREALEAILEQAFEDGAVTDAVLAESLDQRHSFWRLREGLPEAQKHEGGSIKHDVSVPVSRVPEFLHRAGAAVEAALPGIRIVAFGHVGDGNIHFNLTQPIGADKAAYLDEWERLNRIVHDIVVDMDGSISAEHGIGILKRDELAHYKDPLDIELMKRIKKALDPAGLMNPGKVI